MINYPRRLIEVDLPIGRISEHARKEKNLRSGHPWHLHIWWARRPWGACRSMELASLLPDPVDPHCPEAFLVSAAEALSKFGPKISPDKRQALRDAILNFIGEMADWDLGNNPLYVSTAKKLIKAAHSHGKPVVFDSFAGNGAIPGEALRLGCESIALELNPVANLILRSILEAAPRHGSKLLEGFIKGSTFIKKEAEKRLSAYYPKKDGKYPIAWLWARTVVCEGPRCGATIPLISQTVITEGKRKVWIEVNGDQATKAIAVHMRQGKAIPRNLTKTAGGGAAFCPVCGYTTPKDGVKRQGKEGRMGNRLYGVAVPVGERKGKDYFDSTVDDEKSFQLASKKWRELVNAGEAIELEEPFVLTYGLHVPPHYGISKWGDLFSDRQKLALHTIAATLGEYAIALQKGGTEPALIRDVVTAIALGISNSMHYWTRMSAWLAEHMVSSYITGNAIAMRWDWAEANPLVPGYVGGLEYALTQAETGVQAAINLGDQPATILPGNATQVPLPDDAVDMFFTDPPYYDVVPYADLADLCYVWLKRFLKEHHADLLAADLTPKADQIVVNPYVPEDGRGEQTPERYQERMTQAFREGKRILKPDGIGAIVFAHKGTEAWEALLSAVIDAGFVVTASWPIDTERAARMRANQSAALGSSVHLIVRPRVKAEGKLGEQVGDWRDVLQELPRCIQEWLPRLAIEGVVGADAIFACLGPALEIFSRYQRVEKASGEQVTLKEYLEYIWAAVAKEALNMIFAGADTTGFEEDARLTAMWLWTMSTGGNGNGRGNGEGEVRASSGYLLEYDAARKIAQGLGAHLERLTSVVEVKGDKARLLPVSERTRYLFGKADYQETRVRLKEKDKQMKLGFMADLEAAEEQGSFDAIPAPAAGKSVLDHVHQAMVLFAAGRGEALKRFLVEGGVGREARFWRLAQALSALYPASVDEKRWVDGVLAKKKGLGF